MRVGFSCVFYPITQISKPSLREEFFNRLGRTYRETLAPGGVSTGNTPTLVLCHTDLRLHNYLALDGVGDQTFVVGVVQNLLCFFCGVLITYHDFGT